MGGDRGLHKMEGMRRAYNIRMQEKGWDEMRYHGGRCKIRMVTLSYCSQPHCEQVGPTWVHAIHQGLGDTMLYTLIRWAEQNQPNRP